MTPGFTRKPILTKSVKKSKSSKGLKAIYSIEDFSFKDNTLIDQEAGNRRNI